MLKNNGQKSYVATDHIATDKAYIPIIATRLYKTNFIFLFRRSA